jgi:hypothetical protein
MAVPAKANVPKPSMPQFTVQYVDRSYDIPQTYTTSIDPYTGKEIKTPQGGYHIENKNIEVTIKNQPFTPFKDANGHEISLMYNIRWKGHFEDSWNYYAGKQTSMEFLHNYFSASDSQYSTWVATLSFSEYEEKVGKYEAFIAPPSDGGEIDFQVEALIGYSTETDRSCVMLFGPISHFNFTGESSGWSNTQTLTIESSVTPTDAPTMTPMPTSSATNLPPPDDATAVPNQDIQATLPENSLLIVVSVTAVVVVALLVVVIVFMRRKMSVLEHKIEKVEHKDS